MVEDYSIDVSIDVPESSGESRDESQEETNDNFDNNTFSSDSTSEEKVKSESEPKPGLVSKESSKLPLVEGDINMNELSIIIGPKYILNGIVKTDIKLRITPSHPFLHDAENPLDDDMGDAEFERIRQKRLNSGFLSHEKTKIFAGCRSRFYGRGGITRKNLQGKCDQLKKASVKRGLTGNKLSIGILSRILPTSWRPTPLNLQKIGDSYAFEGVPQLELLSEANLKEIGDSYVFQGSSRLKVWSNPCYSILGRFGKTTNAHFKVLNTTKPLDEVGPQGKNSIILQWSKGGKIKKVRNIRVDGLPVDLSFVERVAFFIDRNQGGMRLYIVKNKLIILLVSGPLATLGIFWLFLVY